MAEKTKAAPSAALPKAPPAPRRKNAYLSRNRAGEGRLIRSGRLCGPRPARFARPAAIQACGEARRCCYADRAFFSGEGETMAKKKPSGKRSRGHRVRRQAAARLAVAARPRRRLVPPPRAPALVELTDPVRPAGRSSRKALGKKELPAAGPSPSGARRPPDAPIAPGRRTSKYSPAGAARPGVPPASRADPPPTQGVSPSPKLKAKATGQNSRSRSRRPSPATSPRVPCRPTVAYISIRGGQEAVPVQRPGQGTVGSRQVGSRQSAVGR